MTDIHIPFLFNKFKHRIFLKHINKADNARYRLSYNGSNTDAGNSHTESNNKYKVKYNIKR